MRTINCMVCNSKLTETDKPIIEQVFTCSTCNTDVHVTLEDMHDACHGWCNAEHEKNKNIPGDKRIFYPDGQIEWKG